MVKYQTLAQLLHASFPGLSARQLQDIIGVNHSTVSRWLADKKQRPTSMENCIKIAKACGIAPQEVFRMVGKPEFAALLEHYQSATPTLSGVYGNPAHKELAQRFDRLLRLGWQSRLAEEIEKLEGYWNFARQPFQELAERLQARAGFLAMSHPKTGQAILNAYKIEPEQALQVLGAPPRGWRQASHSDGALTLTVLMQSSKELDANAVGVMLQVWSSTIQSLLK